MTFTLALLLYRLKPLHRQIFSLTFIETDVSESGARLHAEISSIESKLL